MRTRSAAALACFFALVACGSSPDAAPAPSPTPPVDGGPVDPVTPPGTECTGKPGTIHEASIDVGGEARIYELFVPSGFSCAKRWPLLVDFHGAYRGDMPEEAYINDELLDVAESRGVVVARLRSRAAAQGGVTWYRWDNTSADVPINQTFAKALVESLERTHAVDPDRVWASGYSSGGNMSATFLAMGGSPFKGLAIVAAGLWSRVTLPASFDGSAPLVYMATGYRDLHYAYASKTASTLRARGYGERFFQRETDDGHALLRWHYAELLDFFASGKRPGAEAPKATWTPEPAPTKSSLLDVAHAADGSLVAVDAAGDVLRRSGTIWSIVRAAGAGASPLVAVGAHPTSGVVVAAGASDVLVSTSSGASFEPAPFVPVDPGIGIAYVNGVSVGDAGIVAVGPALYTRSVAPGEWTSTSLGGFDLQTVHVTSAGTSIAAGRFSTLVRVPAGGARRRVEAPSSIGDRFLHAVASSGAEVWVAGEHGTILHSTDDGLTFAVQRSNVEHDLYAIAFRDPGHGVAVGAHGVAVVTNDGGATWEDVSIGKNVMLAGVAFDGATIVAVGEGGLAIRIQR
ncbi:MAG: prolyl oligopeptidase family serine peptidase [Deltaproteobacteria bacterium]|nr:prolyl oligopeptidase family serine peptidase [Deltaproteobacteria bacterium]